MPAFRTSFISLAASTFLAGAAAADEVTMHVPCPSGKVAEITLNDDMDRNSSISAFSGPLIRTCRSFDSGEALMSHFKPVIDAFLEANFSGKPLVAAIRERAPLFQTAGATLSPPATAALLPERNMFMQYCSNIEVDGSGWNSLGGILDLTNWLGNPLREEKNIQTRCGRIYEAAAAATQVPEYEAWLMEHPLLHKDSPGTISGYAAALMMCRMSNATLEHANEDAYFQDLLSSAGEYVLYSPPVEALESICAGFARARPGHNSEWLREHIRETIAYLDDLRACGVKIADRDGAMILSSVPNILRKQRAINYDSFYAATLALSRARVNQMCQHLKQADQPDWTLGVMILANSAEVLKAETGGKPK